MQMVVINLDTMCTKKFLDELLGRSDSGFLSSRPMLSSRARADPSALSQQKTLDLS